MPEKDETQLLAQFSADLKTHAGFGIKRSGSQGDRATAGWISQRLKASGFSVETLPFDVPFFEPKKAELSFAGGKSTSLFVQPVAVTTPEAGITAPVVPVYSIYDAPAVEDKIAVVILPYGRYAAIFVGEVERLLSATAKARPRAIVLVTTGPTGKAVGLNTRAEPVVPMPLAFLAPEDLEGVREFVATRATATLVVEGDAGLRPSWNVIGRRERGDRWLALSTPRTGWFDCASERGTGTAVFLELADWAARHYPDLSIVALNGGAHEIDFGGIHEAMAYAPPPERTAVWAHIGAALATRQAHLLGGRNLGLLNIAESERIVMATDPMMDAAAKYFAGLPGLETPAEVMPGAGELGDIVARGYKNAFAVLGLHRWFHTSEDTLDKTDAKLLLPVYEAHRRMIQGALG